MNLKLKRLVRTTSSEQYAVFDLDQTDEDDQLPMTIGKLDLHYTAEGVYGTMLLWDDASRGLRAAYRRAFIQVLLEDIIQPMGVPNEYVIEFFAPTLDLYEVFHNVEIDEDLDESLDEDPDAYMDEDIGGERDDIDNAYADYEDDGEELENGLARAPYAEYVEGVTDSGGRGRTGEQSANRAEENLEDDPPTAPRA